MQSKSDYFKRRFFGFMIDLFIVSVPFVAYKMFLSSDTRFDILAWITAYVLFVCRDIKGRSFGKRIVGLEIVSRNHPGEKVSKIKLILRNLLMPFWMLEGLSMLFLTENQKFSDKMLGLSVTEQIS